MAFTLPCASILLLIVERPGWVSGACHRLDGTLLAGSFSAQFSCLAVEKGGVQSSTHYLPLHMLTRRYLQLKCQLSSTTLSFRLCWNSGEQSITGGISSGLQHSIALSPLASDVRTLCVLISLNVHYQSRNQINTFQGPEKLKFGWS